MLPGGDWQRAAFAALLALSAAGAAVAAPGRAATMPPAVSGTTLTGAVINYEVRTGDSLARIGARFGVLTRVIARDNGLKPNAALQPGSALMIDNRRVVPALLDHGIAVSVAQRLLFHFENGQLRAAYPVAVGKPSWPTPLGPFRVANLQTDKPWIVPVSIQEEMRREGKRVLTRVEPGPENPLGKHWIGLSIPSLGIHGTTAPTSIHDFRSHGCIRVHPDDIAELFGRVAVGTPGAIVYRTALLAALPDGRIFVEIDRDAYRRAQEPFAALRTLADERGLSERIDWGKVRQIARDQDGLAREVGLPAPAIAAPAAGSAPSGDGRQPANATDHRTGQ